MRELEPIGSNTCNSTLQKGCWWSKSAPMYYKPAEPLESKIPARGIFADHFVQMINANLIKLVCTYRSSIPGGLILSVNLLSQWGQSPVQ